MVSYAVVSPIHLSSVRSRIIVIKAMLLLSIAAHGFGKAAAFQPLRISRTRTITSQLSPPRFLSTQLPMSSSVEQERKVPVEALRSFRSSSSQQQQNDSDTNTLVLDPLIVCGPSGVGTCCIVLSLTFEVSRSLLVPSLTPSYALMFTFFHRQGNDY
jgi:hypothetical protein